jgi:DNA-binding MarR family transcriptional regulator
VIPEAVLTNTAIDIICIKHMLRTTSKGRESLRIRDFRRSLRALEREVELSLASQTECCGVTSAQCHLLLEIDARGKASIGELAEALELDPSTLSRTADGLVKAGLVSRADDPLNRRRQILCLLPPGKEKVDYIDSACDEYYEGILAGADGPRRIALADAVAYLAGSIRAKRLSGVSCCPAPKKGG